MAGLYLLFLLWKRREDRRFWILCAFGLICLLAVITDFEAPRTGSVFLLLPLLGLISHAMVLPLLVHLIALLPRRGSALLRRRWILPGHYAAGLLMALGSAAYTIPRMLEGVSSSWNTSHVATLFHLSYLYAGIFGLVTLERAVVRNNRSTGRAEALLVFFGLLVWCVSAAGNVLFSPALKQSLFFAYLHPLALLCLPLCFLAAFIGNSFFFLALILRKFLVWGLTTGILGALVWSCLALAEVLTARDLGFSLTSWNLILLPILGGLFQPVALRVEFVIDRLFFPGKIKLRELSKKVIPELASFTDFDEASAHLVRRLRRSLDLRSVFLLLADESSEVYRVRASTILGSGTDNLADIVLGREEVERLWLLPRRRPFTWTDRAHLFREDDPCARILNQLNAHYVIPIDFKKSLMGLIVLGKTLSGIELDRSDFYELERLAQQASAMLEHARLFELASNDPLTGLPRRQIFEERLTLELERSRRSFRPLAVALADIDNFKIVNDTWGHLVGDQILKAVAQTLSQDCRSIDLAARYGGEEFVLLFPETASEGAATRSNRLCRRVAKHLVPVRGTRLAVTISIGLMVVREEDLALEPEDLLERADRALYEAKRSGKNKIVLFQEDLPSFQDSVQG